MLVLLVILLALLAYGAWEYHGHQRQVENIPIRIHVNGSRGKSSVTRLIAAGLRAGGIRTVGKTTGTLPRIIDPEGREIAIVRNQRANIIEQVKILRYVSRFNPRALVIECMAVLPEYQWTCEHDMIRSHIGVITNCRLDHTNEMGKFREQIAYSLSNTCPTNGYLFTSEKTNLNVLQEIGEKNHTKVERIGGHSITNAELMRFGYIEHPANIGLALAVCEHVGVDRKTALEGMYNVVPDAGALRVAMCRYEDKELLFVNAMAANDPESSLEIWHQIRERYAPLGKVIILLNSRSDRQDRSVQLVEMASQNIEFDYFALTGEKVQKFMSYLGVNKVPKSKSVPIGWVRPEKVYSILFDLIEDKGTVLAIGNVGAGGLDLFKYFYKLRSFPVMAECPSCHASLMDELTHIDNYPPILMNMRYKDKVGWLKLSSMYGSFNVEIEFDIPKGAIVDFICPHCSEKIIGDEDCPECGIKMVPMNVVGGGTGHICPRRGCKGHRFIRG